MAITYSEFESEQYFPSLDALRCVAIFGVLWHHSGPTSARLTLLNRGFLGVDLFFVLSGFLITTLLLREQGRTGAISLRKFYMRRTLRIFPLYFSYLLLLSTWMLLQHSGTTKAVQFFRALPFYATYTSNRMPSEYHEPAFSRSWSLAVEEQFYLVWPTLLVICGTKHAFRLMLAFLLFMSLADMGYLGGGMLVVGRALAPFSAIAVGLLLAMLLDRPAGFRAASKVLGHQSDVVIVSALLLALLFVPGSVVGLLRLAIHLCMGALLVTVVVSNDHVLSKLFQRRWIIHIGVVSYGVYILHGQIVGPCDRLVDFIATTLGSPSLSGSRLVHFLSLTLVSVFIATLSYRYFESYFLKLKKRYSR